MADIYNNKLDLPVSIRRTNDVPLDDSFVFTTVEAAQEYISAVDGETGQSKSTAYAGQIIYISGEDRYYTVIKTGNTLSLKSRPNTRDITVIDAKRDANANDTTIAAKVKLSTGDPADRELVYDETNKQLKIGTSSGSQVLSPKWNGSDATFDNDVKAKTFTVGNITLDGDDFKLINSLSPYEISEFKVNVYDGVDITKATKIEELKFNFKKDETWKDWTLANTSTGFRYANFLSGETPLIQYRVRYGNSYLVYSNNDSASQVTPSDKIQSNGSYYCVPARVLNPITNVEFKTDESGNYILSWKNPDAIISGIRIIYRTDRYPNHESDVMYAFDDINDTYNIIEDTSITGYVDINTQLFLGSGENCSYDISNIEGLQAGKLYYFYITPCNSNNFYTESDYQRCLVYIPEESPVAQVAEEQGSNTGNSALETLLGV